MVLFQLEGKIFQVPLDQWKPIYDQFAEQCQLEHDEVVAMGGLHILGTERHELAASTISFADAPAARAIPALRDFSSRSKTICCAFSAART